MVTGQGCGLGTGGCKGLCPAANRAWLSYTAFPVWSVKDRSLHKPLRQVTDLLSRAHTWVWALRRLVALLSRIRLFSDRLIGGGDGGGPCTALSLGLRGGGLESKFGRGPRHPRQESDGLVLLVPGVQAGRVFLGYPAGGIDLRIARKSSTTCLVFSIVVRTTR